MLRINKAVKAIKTNSKYFFSYAKKNSKIKSKVGPLRNSSGQLTSKSKEMAEVLLKQYVTVFSKPQDCTNDLNQNDNLNEIPSINFDEKDFIEAIEELSLSSAL